MENRQAKVQGGLKQHYKVLTLCIAMVGGMGGLAYASVPLYKLFCQVTGYGGTTQRADGANGEVSAREVTIRFDANIQRGLDWKFEPAQRSVKVRLGETVKVAYFAENLGNTTRTGTATFNVTPAQAGPYFNKIECFCFTDTVVKPGEKLEMPVVFFVDPQMVETEEGRDVNTITLSYTFFATEKQVAPVVGQIEQKASGKSGG